MSQVPSTSKSSKTVDELFTEAVERDLRKFALYVEEHRIKESNEKRIRYGRYLEELIAKRERELDKIERPDNGYTSEESEQANTERRRKNNNGQGRSRNIEMWEKIRARNRELREEKMRRKKLEEKQELDALFNAMLNDGEGDLSLFDSNDFELNYPEFKEVDKIKHEILAGLNRGIKKEKVEDDKVGNNVKTEDFFKQPKPEPGIFAKKEEMEPEICLKLERYEKKQYQHQLDDIEEISPVNAIKYEDEAAASADAYMEKVPTLYSLNLGQSDLMEEEEFLSDIDITKYTSDEEDEYNYYRRSINSSQNNYKWNFDHATATSASTSTQAIKSAEEQYEQVYIIHDSDSE